MDPTFFESAVAFRRWLDEHYDSSHELWVGFQRKASGKSSLTYPEALDEALCFGWIDGVRKHFDAGSYVIRFTPRRSGSVWSAVNIRRAGELAAEGRMAPAGLRVYAGRDEDAARRYSYEREMVALNPGLEARFRESAAAWAWFQTQPVSYRRPATWWVMSAKKEETRLRRLATLIDDSRNARRVSVLTPE